MTAATGTNTLGFFVWTLAVSIVGWLADVVNNYRKFSAEHIPNPLGQSLSSSWFSGILLLTGVIALLLSAWFISTLHVIYSEHKALLAQRDHAQEILSPIQLEGFELANDIRSFTKECGPLDPLPEEEQRKFRTSVQEHLRNLVESYPHETDTSIQMKVTNGFRLNGLEKRVEEFIRKASLEIPSGSGTLQKGIRDRRALALLARDVEEIALAINYMSSNTVINKGK